MLGALGRGGVDRVRGGGLVLGWAAADEDIARDDQGATGAVASGSGDPRRARRGGGG